MLHGRHRVLVVDDERAIATLLATILEQRGYETDVAFSGEEAVQVARRFLPDLLVSDLVMGGMNGIDAAMEIVSTLPRCKVLLVSGNAAYGDYFEGARANGFEFEMLLKPVPPSELLARIAQILSQSAPQAEPQIQRIIPSR